MLPAEEGGRERAQLLAWLARMRVLRGRYRDAIGDGEVALTAAFEAGDSLAECEVLNTLGMAQGRCMGEIDEGAGPALRQAIEIARRNEDIDSISTAYSNLADMLILSGRTPEALEAARSAQELNIEALTPRRFMRSHDWIEMTVSDVAFRAGDWERCRAHGLVAVGVARLSCRVEHVDVPPAARGRAGPRRRRRGLRPPRPALDRRSRSLVPVRSHPSLSGSRCYGVRAGRRAAAAASASTTTPARTAVEKRA